MKMQHSLFVQAATWVCALSVWTALINEPWQSGTEARAQASQAKKAGPSNSRETGLPPGKAMLWVDRGDLTPSKVYWGAASQVSDPLTRLPSPPFSQFEKDTTSNAMSPKGKLTDSEGVKWTVKFGKEIHADVAAPRLAWALGFGTVEGYYVEAGRVEGITGSTDLGHARGYIKSDGSFSGGARFKRHNKDERFPLDDRGRDMTWNLGKNPGVPPEQLSALLIFDVLVRNWDAQEKNCKVYCTQGPNGPENWYIMNDMGASFADRPSRKWVMDAYQSTSLIKSVSGGFVVFDFADAIPGQGRLHQRIPMAHAQWFRTQLAKLTDDEIQAAFDAAFANSELDRAYLSGDLARIKSVRNQVLSQQIRAEIAAFAGKFRSKIDEFMQKVPPGS